MGKVVHISKVLTELIKNTKRYHELKNKKQLTEEEKTELTFLKNRIFGKYGHETEWWMCLSNTQLELLEKTFLKQS